MTNDYERIAKAITFIQQHTHCQPSLKEIANHLNISEYHFQRLFSQWAGISPKRYLQALTLAEAKTLLQQNNSSTLTTSLALGLSSSSRLYEHFVQLDAVTPTEFKRQGEGLNIAYGYSVSPFGKIFVAQTEKGICQLDFVNTAAELPLIQLQKTWPKATLKANHQMASEISHQLFNPQYPKKPLSLWVKGTNFQLNVWRALLKLPFGSLTCYQDIANAINNPNATRAVGSAIGKNNIAFLIPCHRVLRQNGELGGYRWGELRKHAMLSREQAHFC